MSITGNKGEWSEIYTLFRLLGDMNLYSGDENLEKIESMAYPIIKVLRAELNETLEYEIDQDVVVVNSNQVELHRISVQTFQENAQLLFQKIKESKGSFAIPEIEQFMKDIHCVALKAGSSTKTDITLVVHDERTNQKPMLGFSIKSQVGSPSTLLNAGKTTNFKYKVHAELCAEDVECINSIDSRSKIKDRIQAIKELGGRFEFVGTEQSIFSNNLVLIDSFLPEILSAMVFEFYSTNLSRVTELVNAVEKENALAFDTSNGHCFYSYKIKRFLTDVALGMMPSKVWSGEYDATGGYLVVKDDGDVLCYHIYNRNVFENYLIHNTKLETASSSRHGFGVLYEDGGEMFISLNLQIRFIK